MRLFLFLFWILILRKCFDFAVLNLNFFHFSHKLSL
jgi:hypothetical protein